MIKIGLIYALVAVTTQAAPISVLDHGPIGVALSHAPIAIAHAPLTVKAERYDTHPSYQFKYGVQDPHTGDFKEQEETRDGDVVRGSYSLIESDGSKRRVDYTADSVHGFNAIVSKEPLHHVEHVAHAPIAVAHAPIALGHAPIALEHSHLAIAHAPLAALSHSTAIYHH